MPHVITLISTCKYYSINTVQWSKKDHSQIHFADIMTAIINFNRPRITYNNNVSSHSLILFPLKTLSRNSKK